MKWIAILLLMLGVASAQELTKERIWKGTNGKAFRGIYIRTLADGEKVEIAASSGSCGASSDLIWASVGGLPVLKSTMVAAPV